MLVKVPAHLDPAEFDRLKAEEKARAEDSQRAGTWRHSWRHVGAYANTSIFDVASNEELHAILTGSPSFPFMDITVTALGFMASQLVQESGVQSYLDRIAGVDEAGGDARTKAIVRRIVSDSFTTIDDFDVTAEEFWHASHFSQEAAPEFGSIAPGLGFDHFLDIRMDRADKAAGIAGGTPRTIEGPLYVPGAPSAKSFARSDDGTDTGETSIMHGRVFDLDGK
ncbi:hypothetical protein OY671_007942, partial [Metschnikowia pulcherrima]